MDEDEVVETPAELPEIEEPSKGKAARETVDDWAFLVNALKFNRQA